MPIKAETIEAQNWGRVRSGALIANSLPYIEAEIEKLLHEVELRMIKLVRNGELDTVSAMNGWQEVAALRNLQRRLNALVKVGMSAGETVEEIADGIDK